MGSPRAAMALYVALVLHLVLAALLAMTPAPQHPPGTGQDLGLDLRLRGTESVLAPSPPPGPAAGVTTSRPRRSGEESRPVQVSAPERGVPSGPATLVSDVSDIDAGSPSESTRSGLAVGPGRVQEIRTLAAEQPAMTRGGARPGGGIDRYLASLRQHLHFFRRELPPGTRAGVAEVRFVVSPDGRLESLELFRGSGQAQLDVEALELLRRAQPLPAPGTRALELVVPVRID